MISRRAKSFNQCLAEQREKVIIHRKFILKNSSTSVVEVVNQRDSDILEGFKITCFRKRLSIYTTLNQEVEYLVFGYWKMASPLDPGKPFITSLRAYKWLSHLWAEIKLLESIIFWKCSPGCLFRRVKNSLPLLTLIRVFVSTSLFK